MVAVLLLGVSSEGGEKISGLAREDAQVFSSQTRDDFDLFTGRGVSLGGILFPHFHASGVFGGTTADSVERLAMGHHDPQATSTLTTLEPGLSLRAGDALHGFATYSATTDADGHLDGEWEEAFLKLPQLPGGFEIRGGRFLNRFGFQNSVHSHSWDFANQNLLNGRHLQEGEVITDGGEITWNLPEPFRAALSFSYGKAPDHDEGDHGHAEEEFEFEGEGARFIDDFYSAHFVSHHDYNDFHQHRFTASAAWGDNEFGRTTQIYGIGYEYQWRENGYEPGGRYFRWRTEVAYRRCGAVSGELHHENEHHHEGEDEPHEDEEHHDENGGRRTNLDEFGLYTMMAYGFNDNLEVGLRIGWISGIDESGLDDRFRISPNLTAALNPERTIFLRLQYDYDHSSDFGSEHSAWAQIGLNWGGAEVR